MLWYRCIPLWTQDWPNLTFKCFSVQGSLYTSARVPKRTFRKFYSYHTFCTEKPHRSSEMCPEDGRRWSSKNLCWALSTCIKTHLNGQQISYDILAPPESLAMSAARCPFGLRSSATRWSSSVGTAAAEAVAACSSATYGQVTNKGLQLSRHIALSSLRSTGGTYRSLLNINVFYIQIVKCL